jgi:hypothetical protein
MSTDKVPGVDLSTCVFKSVVSDSNLSVSVTSRFCRAAIRILSCCSVLCESPGFCEVLGIWDAHGGEGAGSICPPFNLTEPAATKTVPIIATRTIRMLFTKPADGASAYALVAATAPDGNLTILD